MMDLMNPKEGMPPASALELLRSLLDRSQQRGTDLLSWREMHRARSRSGDVGPAPETAHIRSKAWTVDQLPETLRERRTELIGGTDRASLIDGMNAGAKSYIADLWNFPITGGILRAHRNVERASRLDLAHVPEGGRVRINPGSMTRLMLAPRPLHVLDPTVTLDDEPVPAALLDLALFTDGCAEAMLKRQGGIHLYLRDVQVPQEARAWSTLFDLTEDHLGLRRGSIRATVMIDSIGGAQNVEEILFELVHHAAGLAIDPQAYLADHVALFSGEDMPVLPDRDGIGADSPLLRALSLHVIAVAHRRGCHAIGAPAFVLPPATARPSPPYLEMLSDKEREAADGHDGTIVGHPGLVNAAMVEFNKSMPRSNQLYLQRNDGITPADLIRRPDGAVTVEGLRSLLRTVLRGMLHGLPTTAPERAQRIHDRSSVRLATRMLWQYRLSRKGVITATGLDIGIDLLRFMARKEADKLFNTAEPRTARRVEQAVTRSMEVLGSDQAPLEPLD